MGASVLAVYVWGARLWGANILILAKAAARVK